MDTVSRISAKPRRSKPRGRHPDKALSAAFIRSAPPGRHADGNGLFLYVKSEGTRSWIQRLVIRGRRRELGLGAVSLVSLAEARDVALANRKLARSGGDPLADKRRAEGVPTFAEAARNVVEQKQSGWRGRYHAHNWLRSLERYAFPRIGKRPVSEVNSADVLEILAPIWHSKAETARAVRQRLRTVLEWAVAMEWRSDNPCDRIGPVLGPQGDIVRHMRALPHQDVAAAVETVRTSELDRRRTIRLAFEFLVLTAGRSAEVRLATWDEMDVAGARVDHRGGADEGEAGAPGSAVRPGGRDSRGRAGARRWRARVSNAEREAGRRVDAAEDAPICTGSGPLRTASGRRFVTGRPSGPTIRGRSSRRRWHMWCRTRSRQRMRGRTCSSGVGS